jgi:heat shock protein HspQ
MSALTARFHLGQVVRHRLFGLRGVVYDVDPEFAPAHGCPLANPPGAARTDQPFYRLLAEDAGSCCTAYVAEHNLVADGCGEPVEHPAVAVLFARFEDGTYGLPARLRQ